jgi:hypothetical protein
MIQNLIDCIKKHDLKFEVIKPRRISPNSIYDEEVKMTYQDQEFIIPVDNEYEDVELSNPVVFFNMTLEEVTHYEESDSFFDWLTGVHQLSKDAEIQEFYERMKKYTPEIRTIIGNEIKPLPYFEIEMNTSLAKALREAKL